jgi:hypothetical protein
MAMDMNGDRMGYATDNMIHSGVFRKVSRILQRHEISLSIENMLIIHEIFAIPDFRSKPYNGIFQISAARGVF